MKKHILITFVLLYHLSLVGQNITMIPIETKKPVKMSFSEINNTAEYVFEGKLLKDETYWRAIRDIRVGHYLQGCNSKIFKITRVFRGNLKRGSIIEVIYPMESRSMALDFKDTVQMPVQGIVRDSINIVFCNSSESFTYDNKIDEHYNLTVKEIFERAYSYSCYRPYDQASVSYFIGNEVNQGGERSKIIFYKHLKTLPNINTKVLIEKDTVEPKVEQHFIYSNVMYNKQKDSIKKSKE